MAATEGDAAGRPVLLCYDGSGNAADAIRAAGRVTSPSRAVVAQVWMPTSALLFHGRVLPSGHPLADAAGAIDEEAAAASNAIAAEGAALAQKAGFETEVETARGAVSVWRHLLEIADHHDACLIVSGMRGRGRGTWLGSVSHGLVNHAMRPVLTVPPAEDSDVEGTSGVA
jgi:nucleotide-binding universal stress UspA family protein